MNDEFNNFCTQDETYNDVNLAVGESVAGDNNQKIAAELEAKSTQITNTTSSQATHKPELVTGTNRSAYLMQN